MGASPLESIPYSSSPAALQTSFALFGPGNKSTAWQMALASSGSESQRRGCPRLEAGVMDRRHPLASAFLLCLATPFRGFSLLLQTRLLEKNTALQTGPRLFFLLYSPVSTKFIGNSTTDRPGKLAPLLAGADKGPWPPTRGDSSPPHSCSEQGPLPLQDAPTRSDSSAPQGPAHLLSLIGDRTSLSSCSLLAKEPSFLLWPCYSDFLFFILASSLRLAICVP